MLAVLQRVSGAAVTIDARTVSSIGKGLLVLVCAVKGDGEEDVEYLAKKVAQMRIFPSCSAGTGIMLDSSSAF